jgi:hypothetical protein
MIVGGRPRLSWWGESRREARVAQTAGCYGDQELDSNKSRGQFCAASGVTLTVRLDDDAAKDTGIAIPRCIGEEAELKHDRSRASAPSPLFQPKQPLLRLSDAHRSFLLRYPKETQAVLRTRSLALYSASVAACPTILAGAEDQMRL